MGSAATIAASVATAIARPGALIDMAAFMFPPPLLDNKSQGDKRCKGSACLASSRFGTRAMRVRVRPPSATGQRLSGWSEGARGGSDQGDSLDPGVASAELQALEVAGAAPGVDVLEVGGGAGGVADGVAGGL